MWRLFKGQVWRWRTYSVPIDLWLKCNRMAPLTARGAEKGDLAAYPPVSQSLSHKETETAKLQRG